jgi:hypothetical protein
MRTGSMGTWFAPIAMVGLYVAVLIGAEAVTAHRAFRQHGGGGPHRRLRQFRAKIPAQTWMIAKPYQ